MITFGPVRIVPTTNEHLHTFWEILNAWPSFWLDKPERPWTLDQFYEWWERNVKSALTGIDIKSGDVVGCGYLDLVYEPYYALIHIFKRKGYLNPKMAAQIMKIGLPWFFERYNIEKIMGIVPEWHKATLQIAKRCGFKKDGKLRHHTKVKGEWADYVMVSILKGEVNGFKHSSNSASAKGS
jgi:[ribosomal protein S5]-alanine N-acetyltransferase